MGEGDHHWGVENLNFVLSISPIPSEFSWNSRDNLLAKIYQTGARIESFQNSWSGWAAHLRVRWSRRTHLGRRLHCAQSHSFSTILHYHSWTKYNLDKTIKDGDIAPWKDLQKNWTRIKEKNKEITIFFIWGGSSSVNIFFSLAFAPLTLRPCVVRM